MKKDNFKNNKKRNWVKIIMGAALLSWDVFKRDKNSQEIEKQQEKGKRRKEKDRKTISPNNQKKTEKNMDMEKEEKEGWLKAKPEKLPAPTYWPFFLALGLVFIFWGILTTWIILSVGLLIFIIALSGWINNLRHEK